MNKIGFVRHEGARILVVDYSQAHDVELRERIAEASRIIRSEPEKSLLVMVRTPDDGLPTETRQLLTRHFEANEPRVRATAVVGAGASLATDATGPDLKTFEDEDAALGWLASRTGPRDSSDERLRFVEHDGETILWIDFRNLSRLELSSRVSRTASVIRSAPARSVLTLTMLHGLRYDEETTSLMKEYVRGNRPHVLAGAVVGLDYLRRIILPLNRITGRKLRAFDDVDSAKDWLVEQKRPAKSV